MPRSTSLSTSSFRSMPRLASLSDVPKDAVLADGEIAFAPRANIVQLRASLRSIARLARGPASSKTFNGQLRAHLPEIQVSFGSYSDGKYNLVTNATLFRRCMMWGSDHFALLLLARISSRRDAVLECVG